MSKTKRMSHVFNEMVVKPGRDIDTAELHFIGGGVSATFFCAQQAHYAAHAINNHDRMADEIAELRAKIAKKDEMVSDLIEALGASVDEAAELRGHLRIMIDESINLAWFKNKTLRSGICSTDLDDPEWHDYQSIAEADEYLNKTSGK